MYILFECLESFLCISRFFLQTNLPNPWMLPHKSTWPDIYNTVHPALIWCSMWDLTLIVMYTHMLAPLRANWIYRLLSCWWINECVWLISMAPTQGSSWVASSSSLFLSHVPSLLQFLIPYCYFLCSFCLTSSLLVCVCVCWLFFWEVGGGAECLWSINPLNAI